MSTRVNREGLMQRTVLLLQWGMERARCQVQHCLLNQGQQGWGPKWAYNCYTTLAPQQMSRCFRVDLESSQIPWQLSVFLASEISSALMGDCGQATLDLWQIPVCLQHRVDSRAPSSGEATWAFVPGMEQPLAESPTREERELQWAVHMAQPK